MGQGRGRWIRGGGDSRSLYCVHVLLFPLSADETKMPQNNHEAVGKFNHLCNGSVVSHFPVRNFITSYILLNKKLKDIFFLTDLL